MGHLFRSLSLVQALKARGHAFFYLLNEHPPALEILKQAGLPFEVIRFDSSSNSWEAALIERFGIQVWINDRLDTDLGHVQAVRAAGALVATFDDRGSGAEASDLNFGPLVFDETLKGKRVLQGADYLALNPEIAKYKRQRRELKSLLVTLGGTDTYGVSVKVVEFLKGSNPSITVVIGPGFMHQAQLKLAVTPEIVVKSFVPSLMEEMARHDLAITGGGVTPFEANAAGLPCIVIANEWFEVPVGRALESLGGCKFAGYHENLDSTMFQLDLPIARMSRLAMETVRLNGADRVVKELEGLLG